MPRVRFRAEGNRPRRGGSGRRPALSRRRTRVIADGHRRTLLKNRLALGTVLVDGFVRGTWKTERTRGRMTLMIEPFEPLAKTDPVALVEEGERLVHFVAEPEDAEAVGVQVAEKP